MSKPRLVNSKSTSFQLAPELLVRMHDLMVKTRALEERLIKMYKQSDGFFWIGGPGEEAFNIPLGLLLKKGEGPKFDYFHGHYRSMGVLLALGADPLDAIRQMKNTSTDPFSGGRNFCGHASIKKWNVAPISSPIEVQYSIAPGTAAANKRHGDGVTVVTGGDAGTAEGDFATCLVWSSRPANPLPILIVVTNNSYGISTPSDGQHGEQRIIDRGAAFGMKTVEMNGNDAEESYLRLKECFDYIRTERKPVMLEAHVSRLYGHSSASGANYVTNEDDPIKKFEERLETAGVLSRDAMKRVWDKHNEEMLRYSQHVRSEPQPSADSIWDHVYSGHFGPGKPAGYR